MMPGGAGIPTSPAEVIQAGETGKETTIEVADETGVLKGIEIEAGTGTGGRTAHQALTGRGPPAGSKT